MGFAHQPAPRADGSVLAANYAYVAAARLPGEYSGRVFQIARYPREDDWLGVDPPTWKFTGTRPARRPGDLEIGRPRP